MRRYDGPLERPQYAASLFWTASIVGLIYGAVGVFWALALSLVPSIGFLIGAAVGAFLWLAVSLVVVTFTDVWSEHQNFGHVLIVALFIWALPMAAVATFIALVVLGIGSIL